MKRIALVIFVMSLAVIAGCSQIQSKIISDVGPIVAADLDSAIAIASTRPATEQQPLACYTGLKAWVNSLPTTAPPLVDVSEAKGLIAGAELARIGILDASTPAAALPPLDQATYNACLVAFADTKIAAIKLAAVVASLSHGAGLAKEAAGLKGQAAALRAASAGVKP